MGRCEQLGDLRRRLDSIAGAIPAGILAVQTGFESTGWRARSCRKKTGPRYKAQRRYAARLFVACPFELVRKASSSWLTAGVILTPRHPADASTSTANIKLKPDRSFMNAGRLSSLAGWPIRDRKWSGRYRCLLSSGLWFVPDIWGNVHRAWVCY